MSDGGFNWAEASEEQRASALAELRAAVTSVVETMSAELTEELVQCGVPYRFIVRVDLVPVEGSGP